jgi:hypothetical protein
MVCSAARAVGPAETSGKSRAGSAAARTERIFIKVTHKTNQTEHMYIC